MIEKNKLLVVGLVALLGYYLYDRTRKMKLVSDLKDGANTDFVEEVVSEQEKISNCEQEWNNKIGSRSKFSSSEARSKSKVDYVANCLKNK
jgi:hypothetical protein